MSSETVGQTARVLLSRGYKPVLVLAGTKRPVHQSWETMEYDPTTIGEFDGPLAGIGLCWGRGHIDVDMEFAHVARIGAVLLPPTSFCWGRPELENAHRVYKVDAPGYRTLKIKNHDRLLMAEIRHNASQSVIPPSRHPESGGLYSWYRDPRTETPRTDEPHPHTPRTDGTSNDGAGSPRAAFHGTQAALSGVGEVLIQDLEAAVKETVFTAVAADLWPLISGSRHDSMMGICGMLLKSGRSLERVQQIAELIVQEGRDPDPQDRLQIPGLTAARLAEGLDVAGYTLVEQTLGADLAKWIAKMFHLPVERLNSVAGIPLNDVGNSEIFCSLFGEDLMYLPFKKDWCAWDGTQWQMMNSSLLEQTMAKKTVKHLATLADGLATAGERNAMRTHALSSGDNNAIQAMIKLSRDNLAAREDELDRDPWLFNVANGTLDLRTGVLLPHDRAHKITKKTAIEYDPKAECPQWLGFLDTVFQGNDGLIEFMHRVSGYCLTANTREQCLFFLYGHGKNGKTTWIEVMTSLCGEYAIRTPAETIIKKKSDGGIPNDVARLRGARFVASKEVDAGTTLAENVVKDLTGGDTITARFMHGEWFDFRPCLKLIMYGNHKPVVRGQDEGIWRRIKLVPFLQQIADPIDDYAGKLIAEEGPGILRWAMEGCLKWQVSGLMTPAVVLNATQEYRNEMDAMGEFLADRFLDNPKEKVTMENVYSLYISWCMTMGERQMSQRVLNAKLVEKGYPKIKSNGKWYLSGLEALPLGAGAYTVASAMAEG